MRGLTPAPLRPAATALALAAIALLTLAPSAIAIHNVSLTRSQARSATQAAYREASAQTARREASDAALRVLLANARTERDAARAHAAAVDADNASLRTLLRKPQAVVQVSSAPKRQVKVKASTPARGGTWVITAYCSCRKCCGKSNGITASGRKASAGTVSAPRSLPFGTRLRIGNLGTFTVRDRGGSIRGHRIDMWVSSHAAAIRFGRRTLRVEVL